MLRPPTSLSERESFTPAREAISTSVPSMISPASRNSSPSSWLPLSLRFVFAYPWLPGSVARETAGAEMPLERQYAGASRRRSYRSIEAPPNGEIEVVGCYPVDDASEPCHLLELVVKDSPSFETVGGITQEDPTQPARELAGRLRRAAPHAQGRRRAARCPGRFPLTRSVGDFRLAFFMHYLDLDRPLITPLGDVAHSRAVSAAQPPLSWLRLRRAVAEVGASHSGGTFRNAGAGQ